MSEHLTVVALVLLAAVMHAGWNAIIKGSAGDRLVSLGLLSGVGALIAAVFLPFIPIPAVASWWALLASIVLHIGYNIFLAKAYKLGDLGKVYPIARGVAPTMVAGGAWIFAGEALSPVGIGAVVLTSVGIASLALERGAQNADRKAVIAAFITGVFIASYTVVDGLGVRASGSPVSYIMWLFFLEGMAMVGVGVAKRGLFRFIAQGRSAAIPSLVGGVMSLSAYGLVLFALGLGGMAQVSALRETSVVLAAILGALFLKEPFGIKRIFAAAIVACGVVLLNGYN